METENVSMILSALSIVGSLGIYWIHDKKIKAQERRINEYEISKIESSKLEAKQAKVRASYVENRGSLTIRIYNKGLSIARNIRIEFNPDEFSDLTRMDQFPFPYLNPEDSTEVYMHLHHGIPDTIEIIMKWDDDYKIDNHYSQIMTI